MSIENLIHFLLLGVGKRSVRVQICNNHMYMSVQRLCVKAWQLPDLRVLEVPICAVSSFCTSFMSSTDFENLHTKPLHPIILELMLLNHCASYREAKVLQHSPRTLLTSSV